MNKTAIFVDGNNIFHSAMQANVQIDYNKLLNVLTEGQEYQKAVFYTGSDANAEKQRSFLHWMTHNGWRVVKKEVKQDRDTNTRKAHLEVEIATDMMLSVINNIDTIILVSGDEDFAYTLGKLQDRDIRIVVAGFRDSMSNKLLDVADIFIDLGMVDVAKDSKEVE
jgi:uncharacterized LabA/DUF88 family protein